MLLPLPPVWDVLHLAHGPFQQCADGAATFLALTRPDAPGEDELLDRFAAMLDPTRHALVRLSASAPPAARALRARGHDERRCCATGSRRAEVDQVDWPGRGRDAPLYALAERPRERRLGRLVWRQIAERRPRLAIVPLGATEQHGPHLPFATDTLIADALAARLAARFDDAVALPAVAVGCSSEHMAFPGTLDVTPETLTALLTDVLRSLARHGVTTRVRLLRARRQRGGAARRRARVDGRGGRAPGPDRDRPRRASRPACTTKPRALGISAEAAGHHAGEVETSIMLALHPELVRADAFGARLRELRHRRAGALLSRPPPARARRYRRRSARCRGAARRALSGGMGRSCSKRRFASPQSRPKKRQ